MSEVTLYRGGGGLGGRGFRRAPASRERERDKQREREKDREKRDRERVCVRESERIPWWW